MDDVLVNKAATIERCLKRIREEYLGHEEELLTDLSRQDAVILNLQRACEATIDMGMRMVRLKQLGIPQSSRDIFVLLSDAGIIKSDLGIHLQGMVGFRNIAIHDYQKMNLDIVRYLIENRLGDLSQFAQLAFTIV